jgi:hypothetical protein
MGSRSSITAPAMTATSDAMSLYEEKARQMVS